MDVILECTAKLLFSVVHNLLFYGLFHHAVFRYRTVILFEGTHVAFAQLNLTCRTASFFQFSNNLTGSLTVSLLPRKNGGVSDINNR